MADIFAVARDRAATHRVRNVLVPTKETGATVKRAQEVFGRGCRFFAVGNPPSSHERGLCLHRGISDETRAELEGLGITVLLGERSINQGLGHHLDYRPQIGGRYYDVWRHMETCAPLKQWMDAIASEGPFSVIGLLMRAFLWFGEGGKVCLECVLMAADTGGLPLDEPCVVIARPVDPGVPDVCMIVQPTTTEQVLTRRFGIVDLTQVAKSG